VKSSLKHIAILCFAASIVTPAFAQSGGADTYKAKCAMCHGQNGLGDTPAGKAMKAPFFKDPAVIKVSDAELIAAVTKGKNKMPAYKDKLTDAQIKAVVAYVRALQK
jgi:mono/diheme cytochrome c family protein